MGAGTALGFGSVVVLMLVCITAVRQSGYA